MSGERKYDGREGKRGRGGDGGVMTVGRVSRQPAVGPLSRWRGPGRCRKRHRGGLVDKGVGSE